MAAMASNQNSAPTKMSSSRSTINTAQPKGKAAACSVYTHKDFELDSYIINWLGHYKYDNALMTELVNKHLIQGERGMAHSVMLTLSSARWAQLEGSFTISEPGTDAWHQIESDIPALVECFYLRPTAVQTGSWVDNEPMVIGDQQ